MFNNGKTWTEEEVILLKQLADKGLYATQMVEYFEERTAESIRNKLTHEKIPFRKQRKHYTNDEIELIRNMSMDGLFLKDIHEIIPHFSKESIRLKMRKEGIKINQPGRQNIHEDGKIRCLRCNELKERSEYSESGLKSHKYLCIICNRIVSSEKSKIRRLNKIKKEVSSTKEFVNNGKTRLCLTCNKYLDLDNFSWQSKGKTLKAHCNKCRSKQYKEYSKGKK